MQFLEVVDSVKRVALRECHILAKNPMYWFSIVIFPIFIIFFFTSLMHEGMPSSLPAAVVDQDQTSTSRSLIRTLDAFQTVHVKYKFSNVAEARNAMQRGEIYAFYYIPEGTTADLMASRQPKVSFYYNSSFLLAGALLYRDMRTVSTLASAKVGAAKMQAMGLTMSQIEAILQPIKVETHPTQNPWLNYNYYLSTTIIPGCIMLFIFLVTAYSIGTELKFGTAKEWVAEAGGNMHIALIGKFIPQGILFMLVVGLYLFHLFVVLKFPHACHFWQIIPYGLLMVVASQAFGVLVFIIFPSLRMSMSICSLWAVLSFSVSGFAFPVEAMDSPIQALSWLFPLRHLFMIYQIEILNGADGWYCWPHYMVLILIIFIPAFLAGRLKRMMENYVYIP